MLRILATMNETVSLASSIIVSYFRRFRWSPLLFRKVLRRWGLLYPNSVDGVNKVEN